MYKCPNCHEIYDEPRRIIGAREWIDGFPRIDYEDICPFCKESHHPDNEVFMCEECGEYYRDDELIRTDDDYRLCRGCVCREEDNYEV